MAQPHTHDQALGAIAALALLRLFTAEEDEAGFPDEEAQDDVDAILEQADPEQLQLLLEETGGEEERAGPEVNLSTVLGRETDALTLALAPLAAGLKRLEEDVCLLKAEMIARARLPMVESQPVALPGPLFVPLPKLGCALFNLPEPLAGKVRALAMQVEETDLAPDGREVDPHITALFGLAPEIGPDDAARVLSEQGPVRIRLGQVALFESPEHDVLHIEVNSPELHSLNAILRELPYRNDHPVYKAHVTIAYVFPGTGQKYLHLNQLEGEEAILSDLVLSGAHGKTVLPLGNKGIELATFTEAPDRRSPRGGVTLRGTFFPGGRFIPKEIFGSMSAEDRKAFEAAKAGRAPGAPAAGAGGQTQGAAAPGPQTQGAAAPGPQTQGAGGGGGSGAESTLIAAEQLANGTVLLILESPPGSPEYQKWGGQAKKPDEPEQTEKTQGWARSE